MLTARRFSEFNTSVIRCQAVLVICLGSFLPLGRYVLMLRQSIGSKETKIKVFCENNAYFDSLFQCIATQGPDISFELHAQYVNSVLLLKHEYHIYFGPGFLQRLS